jgi:hypothetical protein
MRSASLGPLMQSNDHFLHPALTRFAHERRATLARPTVHVGALALFASADPGPVTA